MLGNREKVFCVRRSEKGVSMLEFAIILPFMVILLVGTVDLSFGLLNYMSLSQIVREGVRLGSTLPGLTERIFDNSDSDYDTAITSCDTHPGPPGFPCGHALMHRRVNQLRQLNANLFGMDNQEFSISSTFTRDLGAGLTDTNEDTVRVVVSTRFDGIFLSSWPIQVSQVAPYLSRSD